MRIEDKRVLAEGMATDIGRLSNELENEEIEREDGLLHKRPVFHFGPDVTADEHSLYRLGRLDGLRFRQREIQRIKQELENGHAK